MWRVASFPLQGVATALCSSSIGAHAASSPSASLSSLIGAVPKKFGDLYAPPSRHLDHGKSRTRVAKFYPSITVGEARQRVHDGAFLGYLCADAGIVTKCGARPSRQSPAPRQLSHRVGIGAPSSLGASKSSSPGSGGVTAVVAIGGRRGPWRGAHALGARGVHEAGGCRRTGVLPRRGPSRGAHAP